jgi:hypothetical protein
VQASTCSEATIVTKLMLLCTWFHNLIQVRTQSSSVESSHASPAAGAVLQYYSVLMCDLVVKLPDYLSTFNRRPMEWPMGWPGRHPRKVVQDARQPNCYTTHCDESLCHFANDELRAGCTGHRSCFWPVHLLRVLLPAKCRVPSHM